MAVKYFKRDDSVYDYRDADVLICNKERTVVVGILYIHGQDTAPRIVFMANGNVAKQVLSEAKSIGFSVNKNSPFANIMYVEYEVGDELKPELYQVAAEILALVYTERNNTKKKKKKRNKRKGGK